MRIAQTRLSIDTALREIKEITAEITRWVERQHIALELPTVYISHTSASLLIQETASPDVRRDLDAFLRRIVPEDMSLYRRNDEGPDDMTAHIKERAQDGCRHQHRAELQHRVTWQSSAEHALRIND